MDDKTDYYAFFNSLSDEQKMIFLQAGMTAINSTWDEWEDDEQT